MFAIQEYKNKIIAVQELTSTLILFSPYTAAPGTKLKVTNASSFPLAINTPS